jgi:hypothetical protein
LKRRRSGLRRVDPTDAVRNRHRLPVPRQDVRQALRHPQGLQDARQVRTQGDGADADRPRSKSQFHLQGKFQQQQLY